MYSHRAQDTRVPILSVILALPFDTLKKSDINNSRLMFLGGLAAAEPLEKRKKALDQRTNDYAYKLLT